MLLIQTVNDAWHLNELWTSYRNFTGPGIQDPQILRSADFIPVWLQVTS